MSNPDSKVIDIVVDTEEGKKFVEPAPDKLYRVSVLTKDPEMVARCIPYDAILRGTSAAIEEIPQLSPEEVQMLTPVGYVDSGPNPDFGKELPEIGPVYTLEQADRDLGKVVREYEEQQADTIVYSFKDNFQMEMWYLNTGLNEEAGEVGGIIKKWMRGDYDLQNDPERLMAVRKELGDVFWYGIRMAHLIGSSLSEILQINRDKLAARYQEGTIQGNGDDR